MLEEVTMERVVAKENMQAALASVKANKGGPGVDGMRIAEMEEHLREHWASMRAKLLDGEYRPAALRAADIPKANGDIRHLRIPTVLDRMIQQALLGAMTPVFESEFSDSSYGYRPGRSAQDAVLAAREYVAAGKCWVVDIDLKNFFDQINHDRLMTMVGSRVSDKRVLKLIGGYLRAPEQSADGKREARTEGTSQGGPLSPLLANIYLNPLDKELESRGLSFVRYADDMSIFASSERSAQRILTSVVKWLEKHLGLQINLDKSSVSSSSSSILLSFRLYEDGRIGIAPKAIAKLKGKVRECWNGRQSITIEDLRRQWRQYIDGWWNYFEIADWRREVEDLSGWIRRHMRKYFWLRWHDRRGRLRKLRRFGVTGRGLGLAWSCRGAWALARSRTMHQALKNRTLAAGGFGIPWDFVAKSK